MSKNLQIKLLTVSLALLSLKGCIGTDIVDDFVEPRISVQNPISAMIVGDSYQFEASYFNNIGLKQSASFEWASTNTMVLEIDATGLASAVSPGETLVSFSANNITGSFPISVFDPALVDEDSLRKAQEQQGTRTAMLKTVSSYALQGTATLKEEGGLKLSLSDDFATTDALPGLYLYLTNNTNSINNALEIGAVEQFSGAQVYQIEGSVELSDYSHVLFYCKPFRVPVGVGEFMP